MQAGLIVAPLELSSPNYISVILVTMRCSETNLCAFSDTDLQSCDMLALFFSHRPIVRLAPTQADL